MMHKLLIKIALAVALFGAGLAIFIASRKDEPKQIAVVHVQQQSMVVGTGRLFQIVLR